MTLQDQRVNDEGVTVYYFFKFVNDMENKDVFMYASSLAHYQRYTEISFTEGTHVTLKPEGFWKYTVYEVTADDLTDDSTLTAADIVEKGKLFVKDDNTTEISYTQYTPTSNENTTNENNVYLSI
jgi:hypothetical protein